MSMEVGCAAASSGQPGPLGTNPLSSALATTSKLSKTGFTPAPFLVGHGEHGEKKLISIKLTKNFLKISIFRHIFCKVEAKTT